MILAYYIPVDDEHSIISLRFYNKITGFKPVDRLIAKLGSVANKIVERQDILMISNALYASTPRQIFRGSRFMHQLYKNEDLVVFWNSEKCFHAKKCVGGSPKTFDINKKPWINLEGEDNKEVWQAIEKCP